MKKALKIILDAAILFAAFVCIGMITDGGSTAAVGIILLVILLFCFIRMNFKKRKQKQKKPNKNKSKGTQATDTRTTEQRTEPVYAKPTEKPEQPPRPRKSRKFDIVGVTFNGRQNYLHKIAEYEEPFLGCFYELQKTEYKGELAFQVVAHIDDGSERVLGFISRDDIPEVDEIFDSVTGETVDVYGGPDYENEDKNYGASITLYLD